jgi:hypothetical protein
MLSTFISPHAEWDHWFPLPSIDFKLQITQKQYGGNAHLDLKSYLGNIISQQNTASSNHSCSRSKELASLLQHYHNSHPCPW